MGFVIIMQGTRMKYINVLSIIASIFSAHNRLRARWGLSMSTTKIGDGYEFADWGQSQLGRASGQTLSPGLSLNHLYTHGVLFNLTNLA
jgi:hypothetical protein